MGRPAQRAVRGRVAGALAEVAIAVPLCLCTVRPVHLQRGVRHPHLGIIERPLNQRHDRAGRHPIGDGLINAQHAAHMPRGLARVAVVRAGGALSLAVGETVILLHPPLPSVHSSCFNRDEEGGAAE